MKTLTQDQIDAVIDWMNNWEQLKDTAIPIRFKDDWTKQLNLDIVSQSRIEKPPLGLKPKWIHDQQRQGEIIAAINRYLEAGKTPPSKTDVSCRTCKNCGHRVGEMGNAKCMLSGYYCNTERKYPTVCGEDFHGWIPRPKSKGLKSWLLSLWYGS